MLFTRRTMHVRDHKGQIGFPGGVREPGETFRATALREAEEEVGLAGGAVEMIGELDDSVTITSYIIAPFVGVIPCPYPFRLNEREVAELIEVPVARLMSPGAFGKHRVMSGKGAERLVDSFHCDGRDIWGATAAIVVEFLQEALDWRPPDAAEGFPRPC